MLHTSPKGPRARQGLSGLALCALARLLGSWFVHDGIAAGGHVASSYMDAHAGCAV